MPALYFRLLERSPFTLVIELTHDFSGEPQLIFEPNVRIRVCLDDSGSLFNASIIFVMCAGEQI